MIKVFKKFAFVLAVVSTLVLSSCAAYNYSSSTDRSTATVLLAENNYKVVGRVSGEVSCHKILGFCFSDQYLRNSAISKMYENANLSGSQTIIDIHVVKSTSLFLIVTDETMIATGTVIEFTGPSNTRAKSK